MDYLVIDSSVAIKWFDDEPFSAEARRILVPYYAGERQFLAPALLDAEMGNIIWKKVQRGMEEADAKAILDAFRAFRVVGFLRYATSDLFNDAYRIAVAHHRSFYDSLYLALSVRADCPFVTADKKLVNAVGPAFPNVIWVANWP